MYGTFLSQHGYTEMEKIMGYNENLLHIICFRS